MQYQAQINWQESEEALYTLSRQEDAPHNQRRLQTLCLLRQGKTIQEAAWAAGVHPRTVQQWVLWYRQGGVKEVCRRRAGRYGNQTFNVEPLLEIEPEAIIQSQPTPPALPTNGASKPIRTNYQFEAGESVPDGIKRIITEQADRAMWQLTDSPHGRDKGVHDARKCFKKIRAVLRLVRDEIGEDSFKRENISFRDAGRRLAPVRESAVLVQTFDRLCERFAGQLAPNAFTGLRDELIAMHYAISERILEHENNVEEVTAVLQEAQQRLADLPLVHTNFSAFDGGLRRVYRRGRNRLADAYAAPTAKSLHEWRKRLKYLWYHMRILKPLWANQLTALTIELSDIADWLGDDHDLFELRLVVQGHPEWFRNQAELQVLLALIDYWRRELQITAYPFGRRIYVERPRVFINRIAAYWQVWRAEMENAP